MKLLSTPVPYFIHTVGADYRTMRANGGTTLRMTRYNPLAAALVPIGNSGQTPPAQQLTAVNIDAVVGFYGTYVELNEQVTLQRQDPVLNEAAERLGVSLRQTEDELTRDRLLSTMSQVNCTGGSNGDNPTELPFSDVVNVVKQLRSNNAYEFMDGIIGENRFGTSPTRDAYLAMGSTQLQGQFENISQFTYKWNYPSIQSTMPSEYGAIANVRFLLSSIGAKLPNASANGADVYPLIVIGRESYCIVEQDRYSSSFIYRPPIFSSPLALNATVGWKMAYAGVITNDAWVFLLNSTLS
jgi:N4-gp56 family major capsid protein